MSKLGFTLAGEGHPIIPVMLGDATLAQAMARDAGKGRLCHRLFVPGGAERPGPYPHADVGGAYGWRRSIARSKRLRANSAS
jgi:hypothetical protein